MATQELGIKLNLQGVAEVNGGLGQIVTKLGDLDTKTTKVGDAFKGVGSAIAGALSIGAIGAWLKSAVDAADETFNLSQKVGIAAKDLGGLQLAFKQTGVESGAMQKALVTLSRSVLDGDKAFGDLGVSVRNADGSLKGSKDVLYAVADVFAEMPDGIEKTAYATEIFGKAGADLIPMLNGGSEGLREMASMAQKLGLVIDDEAAAAADQFNDTVELLGLGLQGVGRQVAAQLLPTLTNLAGSLLESMTQGDALKRTADFLSAALKGLYSVAVGIIEAFDTVGKVLGGVAAAAMLAVKGDFAGAKEALSAMKDDITDGWNKSGQAINKVWSDTADNSVVQAAKIVKAGNSVKESAGEVSKEQQKAQKAAEDYATAGAKLAESLLLQDEGLSGDFKDKFDKLTAAYVAGKISLENYQAASQQLVEQQPYFKAAIKAQEQALKDEEAALRLVEKANADAAAARVKQFDSVAASTAKLKEDIEAQRASNESLLTGKDRSEELAIAKLREAAVSADRQAIIAMERGEDEALAEQFRDQAQALRDLADLKEQGVHIKTAKESAAEWKKTAESITQDLTDALMRGFENGKGFVENLVDYIKNKFKTMVAEYIVKPLMEPLGQAIAGFMAPVRDAISGMVSGLSSQIGKLITDLTGISLRSAGTSAAGSAAGSATAGAGAAAAGSAAAGTAAAGTAAGTAAATGSAAVGTAAAATGATAAGITTAGSVAGEAAIALGVDTALSTAAGTTAAAASGSAAAGSSAAAIGLESVAAAVPWALAAIAAYQILFGGDTSGTPHMGGSVQADANGATPTDGSGIGFKVDRDDRVVSQLSALGTNLATSLNNQRAAAGLPRDVAVELGYADDSSKDGAWGQFKLMVGGQTLAFWGSRNKWPGQALANGAEGWAQFIGLIDETVKSVFSGGMAGKPSGIALPEDFLAAGANMPAGWNGWNAKDKIDWLNGHNVSADALRSMGTSDEDIAWMMANGYTGGSGSSGGGNGYALGGVFTNSLVTRPTAFPMGLMGEAGPEAIMPLARSSDGSLGVRAAQPEQGLWSAVLEQLTAMRAELRATASHTSKTAKILERVTPDGNSLQTVAAV